MSNHTDLVHLANNVTVALVRLQAEIDNAKAGDAIAFSALAQARAATDRAQQSTYAAACFLEAARTAPRDNVTFIFPRSEQ